jgi:hypothetical protein
MHCFDRNSSGCIGMLPDRFVVLLFFKCVLAWIASMVMVSKLKLDYFGWFCHSTY